MLSYIECCLILQFWRFIYGWRLLYRGRNNAKRMLNLRYLDCLTSFKSAPVSKITNRQFYSLEFHTSYQVTSNIKKTAVVCTMLVFCNDICSKIYLVKFYRLVTMKTFFISLSDTGMVLSVGLSNLQFVDMSSPRNMFVVGTSISVGQTLPNWLNANISSINTSKTFLKNAV